ncbi:MAG: acetyl esterase [Propionibacteriaceae bacterium]|jgi:acetyl esterase|nr:acetyl esterase [Propionibacteriaceae bacterium]
MATFNKLDVLSRVSPQMRAVLDQADPDAYDTNATLPELRAAYIAERSFWNEGGPVMADTITDSIPTSHGAVKIRLHQPQGNGNGQPRPLLAYLHGGGYVLGNLDTHDRIMRILAAESGACVAGIDYALSPEAKFPVALEQCAEVVSQLHQHAADYGIDPNGFALAGDSGGAQLALATLLYLRDHSDASHIKALLLYYGLFGLRDSVSRRLLGGSWDGLTEADLDYYQDCYLASPADSRSPYVDCLSADLGHGIPPAYIAAAELDPLRDDSAALALMLANHGTPYRLEVFEGVIHAFLHNSRMLDTAWEALRHGAAFLRDALSGSGHYDVPGSEAGQSSGDLDSWWTPQNQD